MIKVGDIVRVKDWGRQYSTFDDWFKERQGNLEIDWIIHYAYGDTYHYDNNKCGDIEKYEVLYVEGMYALITITERWRINKVYLINTEALELYDKSIEMTIEEIEEKLGISNLKIVKKHDEENY